MRLQYVLGRIGIFLLAPANWLAMKMLGYRIRDLRVFRETCLKAFSEHPGPWIICPNHLTMVDSLILSYAIFSMRDHLVDFRMLPWNIPERDNFQRNPILAVLCYLCKCIPVNRGGNRDAMKKTLDRCDYVLSTGQNLLIFPEGGRSRTGRVDTEDYSYGVGRFVKEFSNIRILCIYMRGEGQKNFGFIPRFCERFIVKVEVLDPVRLNFNGLRAQREYAGQIIRRLAEMEGNYFASCRQ
jgi:1-acyl-sn-glycerol-3-phosphate acyltransferase